MAGPKIPETQIPENFDIPAFLKSLTSRPGIYKMLDKSEHVIYIGKAKNLKRRVSSYFQAKEHDAKTAHLVSNIHSIEVTVTASDYEAILLESNLIKQFKPRYNIILRDDKSYPYLFLSDHQFPRLSFYRGRKKEKGKYYGPYTNGRLVRESINLLQKIFQLRSCDDTFFSNRSRPCLQYQIKRCKAPCVKLVSEEEYAEDVRLVELFLEGKDKQVLSELAHNMEAASEEQDYELAAILRDQIMNLQKLQESQVINSGDTNADILGVYTHLDHTCVYLLSIRAGRLVGSKPYFYDNQKVLNDEDVLESFISQYYFGEDARTDIPKEIFICKTLPEEKWLTESLNQAAGRKINIVTKARGYRAQWIPMALDNAKHALETRLAAKQDVVKRFDALQQHLKLDVPLERIECFDISHTMGESTVGSCVVFDRNGPKKTDYRRYNIKGITAGDDYAAMRQTILRRYEKTKAKEGVFPELILIDGGKGQLNVAAEALESMQVTEICLIGVAKGVARKSGEETLLIFGQSEPLGLQSNDPAFLLIQQVRDEAHRFAISGHRGQRAKARKGSRLEDVPGVGAKKRKALLQHFGSVAEIEKSSVKELTKVKGISVTLAQEILDTIRK